MSKGRAVTLTKTKYYGILEIHKRCMNKSMEDFEQQLQDFLNYDPLQSSYDPEYGKKVMEQRKKLAEEKGKTLYELYHKPYLKKKKGIGVIETTHDVV